jgi:biotin synthase-like enzyme
LTFRPRLCSDRLLTTPNPEFDADKQMFEQLGLKGKPAHSAPLKSPYEEAAVANA